MPPPDRSASAWFDRGTELGIRRAADPPRWGRCIEHRNNNVAEFAMEFFADPSRKFLLIGGAGFDPRSLTVASLVSGIAPGRVDGLFIREHRPDPPRKLLESADENVRKLQEMMPRLRVEDIDVFASDGAVVLGRRVIECIGAIALREYTDVIIDFSALSIGSSFPASRFLLQNLEVQNIGEQPINLHAMVTASPATDDRIIPSPSTAVQPVHGFQGRLGLHETARAARLWMPQLRFGQRAILDQIFNALQPDDVVPVLPFPAHDPRLGDRLIEHYQPEFDNRWNVDARSIVYSDERSPLDFYRTALRIDDGRYPVFASTGGNLLVVSPIGSKVLALGAMMAAAERDLPVFYVEALSYAADLDTHDFNYTYGDLVHIWLLGEAYPPSKQHADLEQHGTN